MQCEYHGIKFSDSDIVTYPDAPEYTGDNPRTHPFLLHDHGFVLCVVFASNLQDALDAAVDADKLDRFQVSAEDIDNGDYGPDGEDAVCLGNSCEFFDIGSLGIEELPNIPFSWCAQFAAHVEQPAEKS